MNSVAVRLEASSSSFLPFFLFVSQCLTFSLDFAEEMKSVVFFSSIFSLIFFSHIHNKF